MWQTKYLKAINNKKQLIGDKVIRDAVIERFSNLPMLQEVRFEGFTADLVFIDTKKPCLIGVEVKSDRDELQRLAEQLKAGYLKWCNVVVVATTMIHRVEALKILDSEPMFSEVGLFIYKMDGDKKYFEVVREPVFADVSGWTSAKWVGKKHQLYQWKYLLEIMWGQGQA